MKRFIPLASALSLISFGAIAQELRPMQNYSVHFGAVSGSVYVDKTEADPRLVATLSSGQDAAPVRFITTLATGQSATVSVPRSLGEPALEVTFVRRGDQVFVQDGETVVGSIK